MNSFVIIEVLAVILIGYIARKLKLFDDKAVNIFTDFAYYIGLPALIISGLKKATVAELININLIFITIISIIIAIALAYALTRLFKLDRMSTAAVMVASFFGNIAYIGYPVNLLAFGDATVAPVSVIAAIYLIAMFTFGIWIFQRESKVKDHNFKIWKNPIVYSIVIGIILIFIPVHASIINIIKLISDSSTPIILFSIGLFIAGHKLVNPFKKEIMIPVAIKNVILPLIVLGLTIIFPMTLLRSNVSIVEAMMPAGITVFALANHFKVKSQLVAETVIVSMLVSMVALFVFLQFF